MGSIYIKLSKKVETKEEMVLIDSYFIVYLYVDDTYKIRYWDFNDDRFLILADDQSVWVMEDVSIWFFMEDVEDDVPITL